MLAPLVRSGVTYRIYTGKVYSELRKADCVHLHICIPARYRAIWQYRLWSFQTGGTKLETFLPKNQHTQRKFLNFENWTNGEPQ